MKKYQFAFSVLAFLFLLLFLFSGAHAAPDPRPASAPAAPDAIGGGSWERIWRGTGMIFDFDCVVGSECIAVGEEGLILITRDRGATWHQEIIESAPDFYGVSVNGNGLALAVGVKGVIYRTDNRGVSWDAISTPTGSNLHDIWLLDDGQAWAVGDGGIILHSVDGGLTWTAQSSGVTLPLYAVQFLDAQTGYAAGEKGTLLKTVNGGTTWTPVSGAFPGWARINTLSFVDSNTGFVAGQAGNLYRTEDGGQSWTEIAVSKGDDVLATDILAIHFRDGFGVLGGANGVIATSTDGMDWRVQVSISQDTRDVRAVFSGGNDTVWAAGGVKDDAASAFFVNRSDDGVIFEPVVGDYGLHPLLHEVAVPSRDVAFVVGSGGAIGKTVDGGETWRWEHFESKFPVTPVISGISCPTVDDCWIAGQVSGNPGILYATHDGGDTWEWQTPPGSQWPWLYDVEMVDAMNGHAAANPYMFYTTDGGATWLQSATSGNTANVEISMASLYEGWTVQRHYGHRFTTNGGKSWDRIFPIEQEGLAFFGVETLDVNQDGGLDMSWVVGCEWIKSEDRCVPNTGVVFFAAGHQDPGYPQSLPPGTPQLYTITMLDGRRGWVGGADGVLLYTETGGATWRTVEVPTSSLITEIAFHRDKIGFLTTYAGEILRFRGPGRNLNSYTQSTSIIVDGGIYDWHYGGELYLDADNAGTVLGDEPYPTPDQLSADFYSRWTNDTLYILAEITDDIIGPEDVVRFALDGLDDDVWEGDDDLLLSITASGDFSASSPEAEAAIAHAVGRSETGWIVELGIPAAWLGRDVLMPDVSIGLNLELEDHDGPGMAVTLIMEDRKLLGNPAVWGSIQIVGNTFVLQNGLNEYQGAVDTFLTIWNEDGNTPHGNDEVLQVIYTSGRHFSNALLRFEPPQLLDVATVGDSKLALYIPSAVVREGFRIGAYRLLRPWNPTTATWQQADVGEPWGAVGALKPDVDYDSQPLDVIDIPENPRNTWLVWDVSDAVAYWTDHPQENFGVILLGVNSSQKLLAYSSDYNGDTTQRPKLMIDFTLNPRPTPTPTPTPALRKLYMPLIRR